MLTLLTAIEPFGLYRTFISIVLAGIWLYTVIDSVATLRAGLERERQRRLARATATLSTASDPRQRVRRERLEQLSTHAMRIVRNLLLLKVSRLVSWRTVWLQRRELGFILLLFAANVVAAWYFFTM